MLLTLIWHPEDAKGTIYKQTKYSENENKMYKHKNLLVIQHSE